MVFISNSSHFRTKNCLIASVKIKRPFIAKKWFRICNLILLGHYESRSTIYDSVCVIYCQEMMILIMFWARSDHTDRQSAVRGSIKDH